jgi:hypothetical protein
VEKYFFAFALVAPKFNGSQKNFMCALRVAALSGKKWEIASCMFLEG